MRINTLYLHLCNKNSSSKFHQLFAFCPVCLFCQQYNVYGKFNSLYTICIKDVWSVLQIWLFLVTAVMFGEKCECKLLCSILFTITFSFSFFSDKMHGLAIQVSGQGYGMPQQLKSGNDYCFTFM